MKIGLNPAFLFANYGDKVYFNEVISGCTRAKELGFPSLGLEIYCDEQYDAYTPENLKKIRSHFLNMGMESTAFLACAPRAKLASITREVREEGKRDFQRIVNIVSEIGLTNVISIVSCAPPEAVTSYMDTYPGGPPQSLSLPDWCSWDDVWNLYVETIGECLDMARAKGLKLAVEPLPMSVISSVDSYLRLAGEIKSDDFGILIDTSHLFYQRESLPVVIEKTKGHIFGFCACDNDGVLDYHWAPGKGKIDWKEVLKTLKKVGYDGYIDLEINIAEDPGFVYQSARKYLEDIIKEM